MFITRFKFICAPLIEGSNRREDAFKRLLGGINSRMERIDAMFNSEWANKVKQNTEEGRDPIDPQQILAKLNSISWCRGNIGDSNFFKGSDNVEILKPQKPFDFSTFVGKYENLNGADKTKTLENRKNISISIVFKNFVKVAKPKQTG
jgi:hypothetical protein